MKDIFLEEYSSNQAVLKYSRATAGSGISYLLEHEYADIYLEALRKHLPETSRREGARLLEFGCGAGMNIVHMVSLLERSGIPLKEAFGTDFSKTLIDTASQEADRDLSPGNRKRVRFLWGRNESLLEDLAAGLNVDESSLEGSFDFIFGVNTIRYCHRLEKENECAKGIFRLLKKGGVCVVIDMNQKFPVFRSRVRDKLTMEKKDYYLPSLEEYARPFELAGFVLKRKETFCWIPHSAGPLMSRVCKAMTPVLNTLFRPRAMRCLVVAQKPV
jgi:SAM-dependent methyltransferase